MPGIAYTCPPSCGIQNDSLVHRVISKLIGGMFSEIERKFTRSYTYQIDK